MEHQEEIRLLLVASFLHGMLSSGRWTADDTERDQMIEEANDLAAASMDAVRRDFQH